MPGPKHKKRAERLAPELKKSIGNLFGVEMVAPDLEHKSGFCGIKARWEEGFIKDRFTAVVDMDIDSVIFDLAHEWSHEGQLRKGLELQGELMDTHAQLSATLAMEDLSKMVEPWGDGWKDAVTSSLNAGLARFRGTGYLNGTIISELYMEGHISRELAEKIVKAPSEEELKRLLAEVKDAHTPKIIEKATKRLISADTDEAAARDKSYEYLARFYPEYWDQSIGGKGEFAEKLRKGLGNP